MYSIILFLIGITTLVIAYQDYRFQNSIFAKGFVEFFSRFDVIYAGAAIAAGIVCFFLKV